MKTLSIEADQIAAIKIHAISTYPEECCGILLGRMYPAEQEMTRTVVELWPVTNAWGDEGKRAIAHLNDSPKGHPPEDERPANAPPVQNLTAERRYWIDPRDLLAAQKAGRERGLQIIGIYHSHPNHPAVPSECDRALAWPDYSYIIVSVPDGKATDVLSWTLDDKHQFQPETIQVR